MNTHTEPIRGKRKPLIIKEFIDGYGDRIYICEHGKQHYADRFDYEWNCAYHPPVKPKRYKGKNPHTMNELIHA